MRVVSFVAVLAVLAISVPAGACDKDAKLASDNKPVVASGCCKARVASVVEGVMQRLPHMTYKVGDFETPCPDAARARAGENGTVRFVVDGKTYDSKSEAVVALSERLEAEATSMTKVVFAVGDDTYCCPMTAGQMAKQKNLEMQYRVAGVDFPNREQADKAVKLVSAVLESGAADAAAPAVAEAKPCCGGARAAAAAGSKPCCGGAKAAAAKSDAPPCHGGAKTASAEAEAKPGCSGSRTAATDTEKTDTAKKVQVAAAEAPAAGGCAKARTASAEAPTDCCKKAEERLASVQARIRLMAETAATAL